MGEGLLVGGTRDRLRTGLLPAGDGFFVEARLHRMEREDFRRRVGQRFQGIHQPFVNLLALGLEQAFVRGIAHQRVLESVLSFLRGSPAEDQLRLDQAGEGLVRRIARRRHDRREQTVAEFAADAGCGLGHLLDRP